MIVFAVSAWLLFLLSAYFHARAWWKQEWATRELERLAWRQRGDELRRHNAPPVI